MFYAVLPPGNGPRISPFVTRFFLTRCGFLSRKSRPARRSAGRRSVKKRQLKHNRNELRLPPKKHADLFTTYQQRAVNCFRPPQRAAEAGKNAEKELRMGQASGAAAEAGGPVQTHLPGCEIYLPLSRKSNRPYGALFRGSAPSCGKKVFPIIMFDLVLPMLFSCFNFSSHKNITHGWTISVRRPILH